MDAYTAFATVYDEFMDDIPYEKWHKYIVELLKENNVEKGIVCELGCGTGTMTEMLASSGYDMIGVDLSEDMLMLANEKKYETGSDILYLMQDMCELELYSTVNAFVSICDSVNYILEEEDLIEAFKNVNMYLEEDGVFIFDFKTDYFYKEVLGDTVIARSDDDCSYIWDNYYYEDERVNEYELTIFIKEDNELDDNIFRQFKETHYQRGYTVNDMERIIKSSGLKLDKVYDAFTHDDAKADSERIYIICKKGEV